MTMFDARMTDYVGYVIFFLRSLIVCLCCMCCRIMNIKHENCKSRCIYEVSENVLNNFTLRPWYAARFLQVCSESSQLRSCRFTNASVTPALYVVCNATYSIPTQLNHSRVSLDRFASTKETRLNKYFSSSWMIKKNSVWFLIAIRPQVFRQSSFDSTFYSHMARFSTDTKKLCSVAWDINKSVIA